MTHPLCTWTPALMLHLTNPYAKRKVLSLTKPNGKIYKTKSLGNYITAGVFSQPKEILKNWHKMKWIAELYPNDNATNLISTFRVVDVCMVGSVMAKRVLIPNGIGRRLLLRPWKRCKCCVFSLYNTDNRDALVVTDIVVGNGMFV